MKTMQMWHLRESIREIVTAEYAYLAVKYLIPKHFPWRKAEVFMKACLLRANMMEKFRQLNGMINLGRSSARGN